MVGDISKVLVQVGFRKQRMCLGLFTLHSSAGVLIGFICLPGDMLGTGDDMFGSKLKKLDKLVEFGSMKRQKFDHCGRQYEKHANGEITISMEAYIQNLRKADLTLERMKQLMTNSQRRKVMSSEASTDVCNGLRKSFSIPFSSW